MVASPIQTPLPISPFQEPARPFPALSSLPPWPGTTAATSARPFPATWPSPLADLPALNPVAPVEPPVPFASIPPPPPPGKSEEPPAPDFTDDDLREAFGPIIEQAVRSAVYAKENGIDTYLEPMLRATIRRALAEYSPASRPFRAAGTYDRLVWHLQALFTSRTYEDIVFEKTHRFQVEEVFLLDAETLALISFASCDPARHNSAKRVTPTVHRLALGLLDEEGKVRESFELPDHRNAIACAGGLVNLVAIVRGRPSELILADLEFALRRIEDRFREQFKKDGSPLLFTLQPYLEDCLLIQAPASAA
jgi:hypothetical protein